MKQILKFPDGFLWGAAQSAYQTEGGNVNADWWAWENSAARINWLKQTGHNPDEYKSGLAADNYFRYEEDFALAKQLKHNVHRMSVEWSRIEPREGEYDENVLQHYEKALKTAHAYGLKIFLSLHHFTCPQWFMKKGGFERRRNLKYFLRYAEIVSKRLDPYVDFWQTFNEPEVYCTYPYLLGVFPPQKKNLVSCVRVINNLIRAHNSLTPRIKALSQKPVGMACHLSDLQPASFMGNFTKRLAHFFANEYILAKTNKQCDFIGVNYYNHHHVGFLGLRKSSLTHHQISDMGWGIHPDGLERVLLELTKYKKPIYITENGIADAGDTKREKFIKDHLYFTHRAIAQGADVRGYIYWSLTDNFEWQHGFWPKFGLIEIDRANFLNRKIRASAFEFAKICETNSLEYEL